MTQAFGFIQNEQDANEYLERMRAASKRAKRDYQDFLTMWATHVIATRDARWGSDGPGQPADHNGCAILIKAIEEQLKES